MDPRLPHRLLSQRKLRRTLFLSCLAGGVFFVSYYKTCVVGVLNTITRPQTEIFVTVTETATLTVQEQATRNTTGPHWA